MSPEQDEKIRKVRDRHQHRLLAGRYRLGALLGMGGMGAVFRATDERLGREVAVKVVVLDDAGPADRERHRRRFLREARVAAGIRHPNVVVIHDFGTEGEQGEEVDFLVMELLTGHTLAQRIDELSRRDARLLLAVLSQAAEGVAAGHRMAIAHRDVKPGNLFLVDHGDGRPDVRVVDFGLAKPVEDDGAYGEITTRRPFFTPAYASPEQLRGRDDLGPASDVFSLGVVAYRLFAGVLPFNAEDHERFRNGSPVRVRAPSVHAPEVSPAVERVILHALQADPAARPADAGVLAAAFREAAADVASDAARRSHGVPPRAAPEDDRTEILEPTAEAIPFAGRRASARTETDAPPRREPWEAAAAGAAKAADAAGRGASAAARAVARGFRSLPPVPPKALKIGALVVVAGVALGMVAPRAGDVGAGMVAWLRDAATTDDAERAAGARRANEEGLGLLRQARPEDAVERFRRAVEQNPENAEYQNNLGYALMQARRLPAAVSVLADVVARNPNRAVAHRNLGEAHLLAGDTTQAIEHLDHFAELSRGRNRAWARRTVDELRAAQAASAAPPVDSTTTIPTFAEGPSRTSPPAAEERTAVPIRPSPSTAYRDTFVVGRPRPEPRAQTYVPPPRSYAPKDTIFIGGRP